MVFGFSLHGFEIENTFHNKDLVFRYSIIIIIIIIIVGSQFGAQAQKV